MAEHDDFRIDEINGLLTFLKNIEWKDPWLVGLIIFHITVTVTTILTRNHGNFQIVLFLILLSLVYFSESINELAANYWNSFSRQQYFDSKGIFMSIVFSTPILLNCMVLVYIFLRALVVTNNMCMASWLYQSSQLMTKLKQAQLQAQFSKQKETENRNNQNFSYVNPDLLNKLRKRPGKQSDFEMSDMKSMDATGIEPSAI